MPRVWAAVFSILLLLPRILGDTQVSFVRGGVGASATLNTNITNNNTNSANIVGGTTVNNTQRFSFFAIPSGGTLCGSVLVHEDILVTAAHCAGVFKDQDVYIGPLSLNGADAKEKIKAVEERKHPGFNDVSMENDIMLVKLASKSTITPIAYNKDETLPATNAVATVIGFGASKFGGAVSSKLQQVQVDVQPPKTCDDAYGKLNQTVQFCASRPGKDTCTGDSGGPLISANNQLVGIVSFGYNKCGADGFPGVYSRVGGLDSFIATGICNLSETPPPSCPDPCNTPQNRCNGFFTNKGSMMYRYGDGDCVQTCTSFFTALLRSSGWKCGKCPPVQRKGGTR